MNRASSNGSDLALVHRLLGNQRRLLVIRYLSLFRPGTNVEVRHLARVIRGIETETCPNHVSSRDYESAYNSLIQTHLPKLATNDIIDYDSRQKVVTVTNQTTHYALIAVIVRFIVSH